MHPQPPRVFITPNGIREVPVSSSDALERGVEMGVMVALKWEALYAGVMAVLVTANIVLSLTMNNGITLMGGTVLSIRAGVTVGIISLVGGVPVALVIGGTGGIFVGLFFKRLAYYRLTRTNAIVWGTTAGIIFVSALHLLYIMVWRTTLDLTLSDFLRYFLTYLGNKWWWLLFMGPTLATIASFGELGYRINQRLPRRERWSDYD